MSHRDYTQYANKTADEVVDISDLAVEHEEPTVEPEIVEEITGAPVAEPEIIEETSESEPPVPPTSPTTIKGVISGCSKLNIREKPYATAPVVIVIDGDSSVEVAPSESTAEFYKVYTEFGAVGYCMKKFVRTKAL